MVQQETTASASRRLLDIGEAVDVRGRLARTSIATRLAFSVLAVTVVSLLVTVAVGLDHSEELTDGVVRARFAAVRSSRAIGVETYVRGLETDALQLASSPMAAEAATELGEAVTELTRLDGAVIDSLAVDLVDRYRDELLPRLEDVRGDVVPVGTVLPTGAAAIYLQSTYLAAAENAGIAVRLLGDARDGSRWSDVHADFHPRYRSIADRLGFDDLLLVDAETRVVLYSVEKRADVGTSLELGPFSGSALATLVDDVVRRADDGVTVRDLAPHAPAGDEPRLLVAAPVLDAGRADAVVVVVVAPDELNRIVTGDGEWEEAELGESGEVYLVGPDDRLRSDSRAFVEDRTGFRESVEAAGSVTADELRRIDAAGTTASIQRVDG
ncbi:MAG: hypothetical protein AAGA17_17030, partial [Actinomycetota bacterium]